MQLRRLAIALTCSVIWSLAHAADGVTAREVKIGMANALSGPAAGLGLQLRAGANAYLGKVNAAGGVHGRQIKLVSVDDGYDPARAAAATELLIQKEKVFALFGYVGTPTSAAAVPIASKAGVPYLFPFTGAEFLRNPVNPMVFNLRASYYDEAEALIDRLTGPMGLTKIGLIIQDDEFGEAGKAGVVRALQKRHLKVAMEARYERNTINVDAGLLELGRTMPDAVVFIGTYRPLAQLVRRTRATDAKVKFATVSFIGTSEFIKHARGHGDGVIISQVVPSPIDASDPLVRQYHADVAPPARNYGSLEGYADAMLLVEALRRTGPALSRTALLRTLEKFNANVGGIPVAFSSQRHQGASRVYLTEVKDGNAVPIAEH